MAAPSSKVGRSCNNCPAFLDGPAQSRSIGGTIGGPVCGVKNLPLIMPKQGLDVSKRVLSDVAKKCDQFGRDVVHQPANDETAPEFVVGMDPSVGFPDPPQPSSCFSCANYVDSRTVMNATGWTAGICRARGWLMPESRLNLYSRKCGSFRRQAGPRPRGRELNDFTFFPQFDINYGKVDLVALYRKQLDEFIDPREYPNERALTPGLEARMRQRGIRAWRRIVDPAGYGEDVFLPVYDPDAKILRDGEMVPFLSDEDRELVPVTGSDERPEMYADHGGLLYTMAVLWMKLDETPAWWGQGGVGKTEFARHLAWLMQLPFHRISINGSSQVDDIIGTVLFQGNETVPVYGSLPRAWSSPGIILLDEPNTGPADIWQVIRPLTDNSRTLTVTLGGKPDHLKRNPECYFSMAMNPAWDVRNVGTNQIGDADTSRLVHMFFELPPDPLEREIIQRRVRLDGKELSAAQMDALMKCAAELRPMSAQGELHTSWGVRHNIKAARLLNWFDPKTAFRRAVGDMLEPSQMEIIMTIVGSNFGE